MADRYPETIINPDPSQIIKESWMAIFSKSVVSFEINISIFVTEIIKPITVNKPPKPKINIHVESMNLFRSALFDLNLAKVGIKTDEKIIGDIPVMTAGIDNILK